MPKLGTCGLCPQPAVTWWWQDEHDLDRYLCGHHGDDRADSMVDAGWALMEDLRVEDIPALPALSGDPASH